MRAARPGPSLGKIRSASLRMTSFKIRDQFDGSVLVGGFVAAEDGGAGEGDCVESPYAVAQVADAGAGDLVGHPERIGAEADFADDVGEVAGKNEACDFELRALRGYSLCSQVRAEALTYLISFGLQCRPEGLLHP